MRKSNVFILLVVFGVGSVASASSGERCRTGNDITNQGSILSYFAGPNQEEMIEGISHRSAHAPAEARKKSKNHDYYSAPIAKDLNASEAVLDLSAYHSRFKTLPIREQTSILENKASDVFCRFTRPTAGYTPQDMVYSLNMKRDSEPSMPIYVSGVSGHEVNLEKLESTSGELPESFQPYFVPNVRGQYRHYNKITFRGSNQIDVQLECYKVVNKPATRTPGKGFDFSIDGKYLAQFSFEDLPEAVRSWIHLDCTREELKASPQNSQDEMMSEFEVEVPSAS